MRAWHKTFDLPVVISNCSNNYGPFQFPEKLIPLMTLNALQRKPLPVYGRGLNVRDWLYVEDHAWALATIISRGTIGETYNVGGNEERRNIDVVEAICDLVDEMAPEGSAGSRRDLIITFVDDRPGHDQRYGMDTSKLTRDLGWMPRETFDTGLRKTVEWYVTNPGWWSCAGATTGAGLASAWWPRDERGSGDRSGHRMPWAGRPRTDGGAAARGHIADWAWPRRSRSH